MAIAAIILVLLLPAWYVFRYFQGDLTITSSEQIKNEKISVYAEGTYKTSNRLPIRFETTIIEKVTYKSGRVKYECKTFTT